VTYLLLTLTTVAGVKRSSASVCVSVCLHDKTQTAETTIAKLVTATVHHESRLPIQGQGQGQVYRVTKCKNILKAIEWPARVCTLSSGSSSYATSTSDCNVLYHFMYVKATSAIVPIIIVIEIVLEAHKHIHTFYTYEKLKKKKKKKLIKHTQSKHTNKLD